MWQASLAPDADLLVYGCGVAATGDGQQLGFRAGGTAGCRRGAQHGLDGR